jgi:hypothetical protein
VIQIRPILRFPSHLSQACFNFAKHRQTCPKPDAGKASLNDPLTHERGSIHSQSNMIGVEQVS